MPNPTIMPGATRTFTTSPGGAGGLPVTDSGQWALSGPGAVFVAAGSAFTYPGGIPANPGVNGWGVTFSGSADASSGSIVGSITATVSVPLGATLGTYTLGLVVPCTGLVGPAPLAEGFVIFDVVPPPVMFAGQGGMAAPGVVLLFTSAAFAGRGTLTVVNQWDNCHPAREATVCSAPSREATVCQSPSRVAN